MLFIAHVSVSPLQPILATILTVFFGVALTRKRGWTQVAITLVSTLFLIVASIYITSITSDETIDTHGYHQTAVGAMRYGWNPVYENIGAFNDSGKSPIRLENTKYEKWGDHYPKAHWIFAANIYSVTNSVETGRSMALLIILALFFLTLHYAMTRFGLGLSAILAFLVALNPISVMQMFSYYNDGMSGNLLLIIILLLTMRLDRTYVLFGRVQYSLIVMSLIIFANLKFTGPVYAGFYCVAYLTYVLANKRYRSKYTKPLLLSGATAVLFAVFVVGLSVYPKNVIEKGSPFYPLMGGSAEIDIITPNEPYVFHNMNIVNKFFVSNFSETDNISEDTERNPKLKIPFTFSMQELTYLSTVDPRMAGYGVWFGGILAISISWLLYLVARLFYKRQWEYLYIIAIPLIPTAVIILILQESWWARYLPQLFLIPAIAVVSMLLLKRKYLANMLLFAMLFNTILTLNMQIAGQKEGLAYRKSEEKIVDALLENGKHMPKLYLGDYGGLAYRYYERYGNVTILPKKLEGQDSDSFLKLAKGIIVYR